MGSEMCIRDSNNTAHRFIGNVDHDLSGLSVGLPPGTSVGFTFKQTKDDFRILGAPTTNPQNQYPLTITHMAMHPNPISS